MLAESALGKYLENLHRSSLFALTVYVDDIIVSTSDAATKSHFVLNASKQEGPAAAINAFNIVLEKGSMSVDAERYQRFQRALTEASSEYQRRGITSYFASVNMAQGVEIST